MADRINQYPMLPNFSSAMLQQQHSQQAQQQSQGESHPALQGIPNPENSRMWQVMQQQIQQNTYRGQNGGEMGNQVNQQMADLLRSQSLARVQGQQQIGQQQQQQQQQQFGLASSQMNAPGQHTGFHDQQGGQQGQPQMPAGFGSNMGQNSTSLQANFNNRSTMLHAFNQGTMSRQLEVMGLAQNQTHSNTQTSPSNFAARMAQQQGGMNGQPGQNQQGQTMIFSSPVMPASDMNRTSPPHPSSQTPASMPTQQGGLQPNGQAMPVGRRPMTLNELKDRAAQIQAFITKQEATAMSLNSNRASVEPATFMAQMQGLAADVKNKKELLSKVLQAMNQMAPQGSNNTNGNGPQGGNPGTMQGLSASPGPPSHQAGPSGPSQPPWMTQQGSAQSQAFPIGRTGPQLPARGPSHQPSPQLHPATQMSQNNPQRPGSTSRQLMPTQLPNQISPNMSNQFPGNQFPTQNGQNISQFTLPPPLDKSKFEESYAAFCSSRSMMRDERLMQVDNRPVDLHALHYNVMLEGGATKVTQKDMWSVIGARMGFVQFPGTDTEPAKSGPGVAQQLQHIHSECLLQFDKIYVHSVLQKKGLFSSQTSNNTAGGSQGNNHPASSSQVNNISVPPQGNSGPTGNISGANQVSMMNAVIMYANISAADLRARNIPEQVIHFVEMHRPHLQRTSQQQQMFRGIVQKPTMSGQASEQGRNTDVLGPFPNMLQHASRPPPAQGHPAAGMNIPGINNGQQKAPPNGVPPNMAVSRPSRPTPEQSHEALQFIQRMKTEFVTKNLPAMKQHQVPETQRGDYGRILEQAYRHAQEVEPKLPMYYYVLKDQEMVRKLIAIIYTTREQRRLISNGTQKFILPLNTLSTLIAQVQQVNAQFSAAVAGYVAPMTTAQPPNGQSGPNAPPQRVPPQQGPSHSPQQPPQPSPQQTQTTPSLKPIPPPPGPLPPSNRPAHLNPPAPTHKKKPAINAVVSATVPSTSTPPATTPATSAATPATSAAASPKTPKSPKGKAPAKPKTVVQSKRKPSKVVPPTPEPVPPTAPSPSGSLKRQHEEEEPMVGTPAASNAPSPKKAKTEWDGERSEALVKKEEQIENLKTDDDANAYLEQMAELIRLAAGNDGQESLTSDISETLDMILKGVGQDTTDPGTMASLTMGNVVGRPSSPSSLLASTDEFQDFLDFTSCAADDDYSKPATPDLVVSSSTNPSPESAADSADAAGHAAAGASSDAAKLVNFKIEDSYDSDPLRLGVWKEIDGGESAYYQSDKWNWDGPMPVLDQPWAFAS